jgi:hypothetical protein
VVQHPRPARYLVTRSYCDHAVRSGKLWSCRGVRSWNNATPAASTGGIADNRQDGGGGQVVVRSERRLHGTYTYYFVLTLSRPCFGIGSQNQSQSQSQIQIQSQNQSQSEAPSCSPGPVVSGICRSPSAIRILTWTSDSLAQLRARWERPEQQIMPLAAGNNNSTKATL